MSTKKLMLSLRVVNSDKLASGKKSNCLFTMEDAVVGSDPSHHWCIQDQSGSIHACAFAIEWRDGSYCLRVLNDSLSVNHSLLTVNTGLVRLQQGDEISLQYLVLKSHIGYSQAELRDPLTVSPESLVSNYSNPLEAMMEGVVSGPSSHHQHAGLATTVVNSFSHDPLRVLESENLTTYNTFSTSSDLDQILNKDAYSSPQDSLLSDNGRNKAMDQEFLDLPHISSYPNELKNDPDDKLEQQYVAITPLMRGFGAQLPIHNSQDANDFLEEAGKTLKATIEGLLALQRSQHGLRDKHLRPLEDNPLRLNMDYDTTLSLLFADQKSPVHLSAPAAVAESLHNLRLHHQANQKAITEALNTMLDAFSPERLLTRFTHYLRSNERQERDSAWAWEMYKNYYHELSSSRQQGFEKLFGEVYEQAYDQALRQGMKDSE